MTLITIELPSPVDRVYLSEDSLRYVLDHKEESPFIFKDVYNNVSMTISLDWPQSSPPEHLLNQ